MSNRSGKAVILTTGILIGLTAGAAIFVLFSKYHPELLRLEWKADVQDSIGLPEVSKLSYTIDDPRLLENRHNRIMLPVDSASLDTAVLSLDQFMNLFSGDYPDSILINAYKNQQKNKDGEQIVVMKDELLTIRNIKIRGWGESAENAINIDSLLADDPEFRNEDAFMKVEFWISPINYKGYKMDQNRLILFGIYEYRAVSLSYFDERVYMNYNASWFPVDYSDSFRPFIPVNDKDLIQNLIRQ